MKSRGRADCPRHKKKCETALTLNHTTCGFRLKDGRLHPAGGIVLTWVVWHSTFLYLRFRR